MKKNYCLLLLVAALSWQATQAQNWRPFRPNGDVHAFRGASADTVLTMRLDSAALQGSDSVYYFNHTLRRASSFQWQKSRNNQFGQLLRYTPAQRTYWLYWAGGSFNGFSLDRMLVLKPFARVGDTWSSYFTDYGVQTTLLSRGTQVVDGVMDSVATFRFSTGATVVLSKNNGLVSAPVDLLFGVTNPKMLTLARRPVPAGLSYYNPLALLDLQPGNELGYYQEPIMFSTFPCYSGWLLRRVLSRQVTADSIVYTFQQQSQTTRSMAPNCYGGGGVTTSPVEVVRLAASRHTGRWAGSGTPNTALLPVNADLLAYEYRSVPSSQNSLMLGHPVVPARAGGSCGGPALLRQEVLYRSGSGSSYIYSPGIDALGWQQLVAAGVGPVAQYEHQLVYSRRTVNGTDQTCGSRANFGTLLPSTVARLSAGFQAFPNPATEQVQLQFDAPAPAGSCLAVQDALGRLVWSAPVTVGQTSLVLSLRDRPAGLYLVQLQTAAGVGRAIRVQKLP